MHAARGVTRQYLERSLECHARRGQALNAADPLVPSRGSVRDVDVRSAGGAFSIRILGDGPAAGSAILQRARALSSGAVSVQQL